MIVERQTVHVSDDTGRIAMPEQRTYGDPADDHYTDEQLVRYVYSNHLQSASLELDERGEIISYEEYHPYGTTSYQANNADVQACAKRYRYTGKERDEESGLYYHGARYYVPWLGRWSSVDPLESKYAGWSPYHYVKCNPVMDTDSTGMGGDEDLYGAVPKAVKGGGVAGWHTDFGSTAKKQPAKAPQSKNSGYRLPTSEEWEKSSQSKSKGFIITDNIDNSAAVKEHPIIQGLLMGTANFAAGIVFAPKKIADDPVGTIEGIANLHYAVNVPGSLQSLKLSASIKMSLTEFSNGDTYTRTRMGTEATLTVASFFIPGGGEAKAAGGQASMEALSSVSFGDFAIETTQKALVDLAKRESRFTLTRGGELTNGIYAVSKEAMKKHIYKGIGGKSLFYSDIQNIDRLILEVSEVADESKLWIYNQEGGLRQKSN